MKVLLVLAAVVVVVVAGPATPTNTRLNGAKVVRVVPQTLPQLHHLHHLLLQDHYDFWSEPRALGVPVDIMVTVHQLAQLSSTLGHHGMTGRISINDVGHLIQEQTLQTLHRGPRAMDWTNYHDYDTIQTWMSQLVSDHPDLCSLHKIGTSYEGRDMNVLTVGKGGADKPGIFIDGGIHAREWISPATVTYMVNQLIQNRATFDDLLSNVNFYVIPSINPDGYSYTFTNDRLWRKTRSDTDSPFGCKGADPNRNWDFHWNEVGASSNPCSDIFAGSSPFSEVEMRAVRDEITRLGDKIKVYLTFHSYSQLWMYPWGFTTALPSDWQDLDDLAQDAVNALTAVHGTQYDIGSSTNTIYAAAGGSDDWAKGVGGVKYAYTVELRDQGNYGFLLPPTQIIPTGEETFEALKVVANFVKKTYA